MPCSQLQLLFYIYSLQCEFLDAISKLRMEYWNIIIRASLFVVCSLLFFHRDSRYCGLHQPVVVLHQFYDVIVMFTSFIMSHTHYFVSKLEFFRISLSSFYVTYFKLEELLVSHYSCFCIYNFCILEVQE